MHTIFKASAIGLAASLAGCMNMPTQPSQITSSYVSGLNYEQFDCGRLAAEQESLARRENQLATAQSQRVKTSQMQAFWYGFGQGDGVEASELANVRGQSEAVRTAMSAKRCGVRRQQAAAPAPTAPDPLQVDEVQPASVTPAEVGNRRVKCLTCR